MVPRSASSAERDGTKRLRLALAGPRRELSRRLSRLAHVDVDDVHRVRVATRRIRSQLTVFAPAFGQRRAEVARDVLRDVAHLLADVRNLDVLSSIGALQAPAIAAELEKGRADAANELRRRLIRPSTRRRFDRALRVTTPEHLHLDPEVADAFVLKRVRRGWRRSARRLVDVDTSAKSLHRTRVALKHARYALETVANVEPRHADALDRSLRRAQEVLGKHHDLTVAREWLDESHLDASVRRMALGRLRVRRKHLEKRIPALLKRLGRAGESWDVTVSRRLRAASPGRGSR